LSSKPNTTFIWKNQQESTADLPHTIAERQMAVPAAFHSILDVHLLPGLNNDLGLARKDRKENIRWIAAVVPRYSQIKM